MNGQNDLLLQKEKVLILLINSNEIAKYTILILRKLIEIQVKVIQKYELFGHI